jgi:hypothetical protein
MESIPGGPLGSRVTKDGVIGERQAVSVARDEFLGPRPARISLPLPRRLANRVLWHAHCSDDGPMIHRGGTALPRTLGAASLLCAALSLACVNGQPGADTTSPGVPGGPTAPTAQTVAYTDLQAAFANDCLSCHNNSRAAGNYSMGTYSEVMRDVRPFDAASALVVDTQPGGSMYRYWNGDPQTKAALVFNWVVVYGAPASR